MAKNWKKRSNKRMNRKKHSFKKKKWKPIKGKKGPSNSVYKKYRKFIAPIGIILLSIILFISINVPTEDFAITYPEEGFGSEIINSFIFPTTLDLAFTIILIVTMWFGYKSWLLRIRLLRRNQKLVRNIAAAAILLVIATHIKFNSPLGLIADWLLFLGILAIMAFGTLLILRAIDSINLRSDLNCWGLRIIGALLILLGLFLLSATSVALFIVPVKAVVNNIYWIGSLCVIIIGLFSIFRSKRRYHMIGVWQ